MVMGLYDVVVPHDFVSWRDAARQLLQNDVAPEHVLWQERQQGQRSLLANSATSRAASGAQGGLSHDTALRVPRAFLQLAESVACHASAERWHALYVVLHRLTHGEPALLDVATDPDVHRLWVMDKAVRREIHKLHAFVRFRAVDAPGRAPERAPERAYVAWFEPAHPVLRRATPFFARRFPGMRWSILTPTECAHWDLCTLTFTDGVARASAPAGDELEELWRSYYANIFNPARVATGVMRAEMPQRYWVNLPEARLIAGLIREAPARVSDMLAQYESPAREIPAALRSRVGNVTVPPRAPLGIRSATPSPLDVPGAWDPAHDPGVSVARERRRDAIAHEAHAHDASTYAVHVDDTIVRIGTASWTDPTLLAPGVFYPDGVTTPEARLQFYAEQFPLVEVDATFYVPPTRAMAAAWAARSPDGFVFDIKAFALMTGHAAHVNRMPDWLRRLLPRSVASNERFTARDIPSRIVDDIWQRFLDALAPLGTAGKLGPILLQFPRWFAPTRANADALRLARERLGTVAAAVEFRNPEWVTGRIAARTTALLEQLRLTYVAVDAPPGTRSSMPPSLFVTTPELAMVRLHGRRTDTWEARHAVVSERYRYLYDRAELTEWRDRIAQLASVVRDGATPSTGTSFPATPAPAPSFPDAAKARQGVHVLFNNCHANYGTSNASEITAMLVEFDKARRRPATI